MSTSPFHSVFGNFADCFEQCRLATLYLRRSSCCANSLVAVLWRSCGANIKQGNVKMKLLSPAAKPQEKNFA
jgi:hypothetical protein